MEIKNQKTRKVIKLLWVVAFILLCILSGCKEPDTIIRFGEEYIIPEISKSIPDFFWGKWVRMDGNNDEWYIADGVIFIDNEKYFTSSSTTDEIIFINDHAISKKTENMLTVIPSNNIEFYLFRKSGASGSINGAVLSESVARNITRGLSGIGGIDVIIDNNDNPSNTDETTTDEDGNVYLEDIIIGDEYTITIPEQPGVDDPISIIVTPTFDGENIGFITLNDADQNFKVSYLIDGGDEWGYHYIDQSYDLTLRFTNIGIADMLSADYNITVPSGMSLTGDDLQNILGTVQANGGVKELSFSVRVDSFDDDYQDFDIPITITSYDGENVWDDLLQLRFYRETMTVYVRSESDEVQGVVLSPDTQAFPFKSNGNSGNITIPARFSGYILALSGADYDSETKYAVRINEVPSEDGSSLGSASINEPNNSEEQITNAFLGEDYLGYLGVYDLDFYAIFNTVP